jgi:hypothetical protein
MSNYEFPHIHKEVPSGPPSTYAGLRAVGSLPVADTVIVSETFMVQSGAGLGNETYGHVVSASPDTFTRNQP